MSEAISNAPAGTATAPPAPAESEGAEHPPSPDEPGSDRPVADAVDPGTGAPTDTPTDESADVPAERALVPMESTEQGRSRNLFSRLLAAFWPTAEPTLRSNIEDALAGHAEDGFSPEERALLRNILTLREQRVADVMIPRGDIIALETTTTLAGALECFEESGHSRLPVYGETLDDPRGMIHIRDLMDYIVRLSRGRRRRKDPAREANGEAERRLPAKLDLNKIDLTKTIGGTRLLRPVLFVPPSMPAMDLMALMQARRIQMALVIDEYGGTDGLASLEDVVEAIVGDIEDEHDDAELMVTEREAGVWDVDGRAELEDVSRAVGVDLSGDTDRDEDVDTLGGLIFSRLERVPARGELVQIVPGLEFQVLEADARRIRRVRVSRARPRVRPRRRPEAGPQRAAAE